MRNIVYLLAVTTLLVTSCVKKSYTVTGTMEGSVDGDTVYIMERANRQFVPVDTAIVSKGEFVFKGVQDSAVNRYIVYVGEDDLKPLYIDFFLENGHINIKMMREEGTDVISGTPTNDAYQAFKTKLNQAFKKQRDIYQSMGDASDEEKELKKEKMKDAENELIAAIKEGIESNITSPLSVFLLGSYNYYLDMAEVGKLLEKLPAELQAAETVVRLKGQVEAAERTAEGMKFTDFELLTPEGDPVKLSDYAGKGKLVLVDFWANWCGPCRRAMPELVEIYAEYKDKGFEIVGVSLDKDGESWKKGIEQLSITWPQMSDLKFWDSEVAKIYAIRSIPHLMLLDGEGTIVSRGFSEKDLRGKLNELIK